MYTSSFNKQKIINDPVYGFISISDELLFSIIEHPFFQRLRRIKQLGLTHLVYPGALHTRFHHSLGAMHLMKLAIEVLRSKGHHITPEESTGATLAILLHDIGHTPYSHTLENQLLHNMKHEDLTKMFMERLNVIFDDQLSLAIHIFRNEYPKNFLHQLVSSQLDMDRLDFLKRDSFFTGVAEGVINTDRIINMLDVVNDELVVEAKAIYSVEKFIVARRLMYWQVYLHKTVLAAERMLINLLQRARELMRSGVTLFATPQFNKFLKHTFSGDDFLNNSHLLDDFALLDDFDIFTSIKVWADHEDRILSMLSSGILRRNLLKVQIREVAIPEAELMLIRQKVIKAYHIDPAKVDYLVFADKITNYAYNPYNDRIKLLYKGGEIVDIHESSDQLNVALLTKDVTKYYICYPYLDLNQIQKH